MTVSTEAAKIFSSTGLLQILVMKTILPGLRCLQKGKKKKKTKHKSRTYTLASKAKNTRLAGYLLILRHSPLQSRSQAAELKGRCGK